MSTLAATSPSPHAKVVSDATGPGRGWYRISSANRRGAASGGEQKIARPDADEHRQRRDADLAMPHAPCASHRHHGPARSVLGAPIASTSEVAPRILLGAALACATAASRADRSEEVVEAWGAVFERDVGAVRGEADGVTPAALHQDVEGLGAHVRSAGSGYRFGCRNHREAELWRQQLHDRAWRYGVMRPAGL